MQRVPGRYGMLLGALILLTLTGTSTPPSLLVQGPPPSIDSINPLSGPAVGGAASQSTDVDVTAAADGVVEGSHFGTIQHTARGGGYGGVPIGDVVATIADNDVASVVIIQSGGSTNVTEGGAADSYTVVLGAAPTAQISIVVYGTVRAPASPNNLSFTSANWATTMWRA